MVEGDVESRLESVIRRHVYGGNVMAFKKRDSGAPGPIPGVRGTRVDITGPGGIAILGSYNTVTVNIHEARSSASGDVGPTEPRQLRQEIRAHEWEA